MTDPVGQPILAAAAFKAASSPSENLPKRPFALRHLVGQIGRGSRWVGPIGGAPMGVFLGSAPKRTGDKITGATGVTNGD